MRRVAVIFDNRERPETTGGYCLRALRQLVQAEHFLPDDWARVPRQGFDLYLNIDDGLRYRLPADLHPSAWWAIDTHLDFDRCLTRAHDFDYVFAAQRDGTFRLRDEGISTQWLPLACDPEVHRRHDVTKIWDVCFVGNLLTGPRSELVELLRRAYPRAFVGRRYFDEMARTFSESRLVFNRSVCNDVNMRVFEALACGSLLVTNDLRDNGQAELFRDGVHLATYSSAEELLDKVAYYIAQEEVREQIAAAGRAEALARHTYHHRMQALLGAVEHALARHGSNSFHPGDTSRAKMGPAEVRNGPEGGAYWLQGCSEPTYDPFYFELDRPEVLELVPDSARHVLDIGCGAGRLGQALKARQNVRVVGIERLEAPASAARPRLDQVLVGDVEEMTTSFAPASFDAIVCADVLEHLRDPGGLLRRAYAWLRPGGQLIASLPNVRHLSVVRSLMEGNWTYEAAGILDGTHLQFFTRRDMEDLFRAAGFAVSRVIPIPGPGYAEWEQQGRAGSVRAGQLQVKGLDPEEAEEFYAYQYLVTAVPNRGGEAAAATAPGRRSTAGGSQSTGRSEPADAAVETPAPARRLRFLYLGNFGVSWSDETGVAEALLEQNHVVTRLDERSLSCPAAVLAKLKGGDYDCLLFSKGRIGARPPEAVHASTGGEIAEVIRGTTVPCYTWYFDRAYQYRLSPVREAWMRRVAPLCRVAFVTEEALTRTPWTRWHLLRLGVPRHLVQPCFVPEQERRDVGFLGQVYGDRAEELARVEAVIPVHRINGVYGSDLGATICGHKIILGPCFPSTPGYWSNRIYWVLGHGGFFLAPEVDGMRAEGFVPGVHYAPLGDDPAADVRYWLDRPEERERIARAGQALVLERFTLGHRVAELCRVIGETCS